MQMARISRSDLHEILELTRPMWEDMRKCRLFLTGGTGFFGCWLLESFCYVNQVLHLRASVTVLSRSPQAFAARVPHLAHDPSVTWLKGDIRSFDFPAGEHQFVVHGATDSGGKQSSETPLSLYTSMVEGCNHVLAFAAEHGCRRFLLTSSGAVYGPQTANVPHVSEDHPASGSLLAPFDAYADGKRASELLCSIYSERSTMDCLLARCWTFCGPHLPLNAHFAIGNFIGDVLASKPVRIRGDGTSRRSYLYASDLAVWLWTILFKAPALAPINVGSADSLSVFELAQQVTAIVNPQSEIHLACQPTPGAVATCYVPSVDRARTLLNLRQTVSLREAIKRTVEWHRNRDDLA